MGCSGGTETVRHLLIGYRKWRRQREAFYKALVKAGVQTPQPSEAHPEARLFGDSRATRALLGFLEIIRERENNKQAADWAYRADNWGIEALEERERVGEG